MKKLAIALSILFLHVLQSLLKAAVAIQAATPAVTVTPVGAIASRAIRKVMEHMLPRLTQQIQTAASMTTGLPRAM